MLYDMTYRSAGDCSNHAHLNLQRYLMDKQREIHSTKDDASQSEQAGPWFSIVMAALFFAIFLTLFILAF